MANPVESILPSHIRKTFEQFGVIKPTAWPKLDILINAITSRNTRFDLESDSQGTCTARVFAPEETYTAVDGEPERALARAFYACLKETGSTQLDMFDGDDPDGGPPPADPLALPDVTPERPPSVIEMADRANGALPLGDDAEDGSWTEIEEAGTDPASPGQHPQSRIVDGETFELDDMGRYVNAETGEYLDAFEVPLKTAGGR